ncbi:MAG: hypothetical protein M1543_00605, partial [Firmicutes bacterium]|nr:hypothetical protein [Bacillota bacterium]
MSQLKLNHVADAETTDSRWNWLYKIGGIAALIIIVLTLIQSLVFIAYPPPFPAGAGLPAPRGTTSTP